jgi:hypothetical protein
MPATCGAPGGCRKRNLVPIPDLPLQRFSQDPPRLSSSLTFLSHSLAARTVRGASPDAVKYHCEHGRTPTNTRGGRSLVLKRRMSTVQSRPRRPLQIWPFKRGHRPLRGTAGSISLPMCSGCSSIAHGGYCDATCFGFGILLPSRSDPTASAPWLFVDPTSTAGWPKGPARRWSACMFEVSGRCVHVVSVSPVRQVWPVAGRGEIRLVAVSRRGSVPRPLSTWQVNSPASSACVTAAGPTGSLRRGR